MTDKIDEYLALAQVRTPDELTEAEEASLNALAADDQAEHHTLARALFRKLVRSYSVMRGEYEASNVREHLALDQNERLRAQLEEKADRQIVVLRADNWERSVELLRVVLEHLRGESGNSDHSDGMCAFLKRVGARVERAHELLTKVDDGRHEHREQLRREASGIQWKSLKDLVAEWRSSGMGRADAHAEQEAQVYFQCADELEQAAATTKLSYDGPVVNVEVDGREATTGTLDPHEPERQKRRAQLDALTEVRGLLEHGHARENVLQALSRLNALGDELGKELG